MSGCSRRLLCAGALGAPLGCLSADDMPGERSFISPACGPEFDPADPAWRRYPVSDPPALRPVGQSARIKASKALLDVLVVRLAGDCVAALWGICTHGACNVVWQEEAEQVHCPCHGSVFDVEGTVTVGPATVALPTFDAVLHEDALFVYRPTMAG